MKVSEFKGSEECVHQSEFLEVSSSTQVHHSEFVEVNSLK